MARTKKNDQPRLCYIFTTFPLVSETFLQREIRVIKELTPHLKIYSIYGGKDLFEELPVKRFRMIELAALVYWIPYWMIKKLSVFKWFFSSIFKNPPKYLKNWGETFLGFGFMLIYANSIERWKPDLIHGAWATMPTTASLTLNKLHDLSFSMGAHAYDIFQNGGDCMLQQKVEKSQFIHCSTQFAKKHIKDKGIESSKIHLIRRGLYAYPPLNSLRQEVDVMRILTIGRLVEKKGYFEQMQIYRNLRKRGIPFSVEIVGEGPLRRSLEALIEDYDIAKQVKLIGGIPHEEIQSYYERADFFLFTGVVAADGDRNGLANVIPEAMARGIPVLTTPDSGITENFKHGYEAMILPLKPTDSWVLTLKELAGDYDRRKSLGATARYWVERRFSAQKNSRRLFKIMTTDITERAALEENSEKPTSAS